MAQRLKRFSTSFKVILLLSGLIVAGYLFKITTSGTKQVMLADTDTTAVTHPHTKHKRKHKFKTHLLVTTPVKMVDTPHTAPVKVIQPKIVQTVPIPVAKPISIKHIADTVAQPKSNFLYTTYVHANITGIVKLRDQDSFNANTIADIPENSKVQVLKKGPTYYRVAYNNTIGFVPRWVLHNK